MKKEELLIDIQQMMSATDLTFDPNRWLNKINSVIQHAIADHEASQWKKYPEEKPEYGKKYLCTDVFFKEAFECKYVSPNNWKAYGIVAFRELPKPYQEERQSFGSLNGCHNCKHQDNDDVCKKCDDTWDKWEGGEK